MSRIKPHGPVSPQRMDHFYGAAKPAPASDDTALLRLALEAMERDTAVMQQALETMERNQYAVADTAPHVDVMAYNAAIAALRERLNETENPSFG